DDLGVRADVEDLAQQLQALRGHRRLARGAEVEQHGVGLGAPHGCERLGGFASVHVEIGEHRLEIASQCAIVLEDQELPTLHRDGHRRAPLPSRTWKPTGPDFTLECKAKPDPSCEQTSQLRLETGRVTSRTRSGLDGDTRRRYPASVREASLAASPTRA